MQTRSGCSLPVNDPAAVQLHQLISAEQVQLSGWKPRDHPFQELQRWASSRRSTTPATVKLVELCWGKSDANEENAYLAIYVLYQENVITSDTAGRFCVYWHLCTQQWFWWNPWVMITSGKLHHWKKLQHFPPVLHIRYQCWCLPWGYPCVEEKQESSDFCVSSGEAGSHSQKSLVLVREKGKKLLIPDVLTERTGFDQQKQQENDFSISRRASCL